MNVAMVVEGTSDKYIIEGLRGWFENMGLMVDIRTTGGKGPMIKKSRNHFRACVRQGSKKVFFLVDQDTDVCVLRTRKKLEVDSERLVVVNVVKSEMEAWILADGKCIRECFDKPYQPSGMTDGIRNPKERLFRIFMSKFNYYPSAPVVARMVAPHFSLERASRNNTSARYFRDKVLAVSKNAVT